MRREYSPLTSTEKVKSDASSTKGRVTLPKRMNFQKNSKRGGGIIFNPKIYVADFGPFNRGF